MSINVPTPHVRVAPTHGPAEPVPGRAEVHAAVMEAFADTKWMGNYWYNESFNGSEKKILGLIVELIKLNHKAPFRIFEMGSGPNARAIRLFLEALEGSNFMPGNMGVDFTPACVDSSNAKLGASAFEGVNVAQGDITSPLPNDIADGTAHLVTSMMNTSFYALTPKDMDAFVENVDAALVPNGFFVFDTVKLDYPEAPDSLDKDKAFEDLKNYYDVLLRDYKWKYGEAEESATRKRVYTCGSGVNHYPREVVQAEDIGAAFARNNLSFAAEPFIKYSVEHPEFDSDLAEQLGDEWITNGYLHDFLYQEVAYRLGQLNAGADVIYPLHPINKEIRVELKAVNAAAVEQKVKEITAAFARHYTKEYYLFKKAA
jgi:hypothetical protein